MTESATVAYHALGELPRPTHWWRRRDYGIEDRSGKRFIRPTDVEEVEVELPVEVFPIVAELDLESEEAILGFVRRFGRFGTLDGGMDVVGAQRLAALAELRRLREPLRGWDELGEYVEEIRLGAAHIQALAACRRELERPRFTADRLAREWPRRAPWPRKPPPSRETAASFLARAINAGVSSMSPRLSQEKATDPESVFPDLEQPPTLLALCALELFNHVVADRRIRHCRNERCGQLFTMQEGRTTYGTHRTDVVKFHTVECARAQAQRDYRRRQKDKGSPRASQRGGRT